MGKGMIYLLVAALNVIGAQTAPQNGDDLQRTAISLDQLAAQSPRKVQVISRYRTKTKMLPPLDKEEIARRMASDLELDETAVREALANTAEKPSKIVLAKVLAKQGGVSWQEILKSRSEENLWQQVRAQPTLADEAKEALDNVYADLSVLALDQNSANLGKGRAPGGVSGKGASLLNRSKNR